MKCTSPHEILLQEMCPSKFTSELSDGPNEEGNAMRHKIQSGHEIQNRPTSQKQPASLCPEVNKALCPDLPKGASRGGGVGA